MVVLMQFNYNFNGEANIYSPQLIYYEDIIDQNINYTLSLVDSPNQLWPHIKTHKTKEIVLKLIKKGITKFKCATFSECEIVAQCGAKEVLLAYPLVGPNFSRFCKLINLYNKTEFYALFDDLEQAETFNKLVNTLDSQKIVNTFIDVNVGLDRTGVPLNRLEEFVLQFCKFNNLKIVGLHCYDGQNSDSDIKIRQYRIDKLANKIFETKSKIERLINDKLVIIAGGTPEFACWKKYDVFCSPGTCFVQDAGYEKLFPDLSYYPAACILSRVISHPTNNTFTLDCGYKAIAADPHCRRGILVGLNEKVIEQFQNEEHWVFKMKSGFEDQLPAVGSVVFIIPTHICPTSHLYPYVCVVKNNNFIGEWEIAARNRKINV